MRIIICGEITKPTVVKIPMQMHADITNSYYFQHTQGYKLCSPWKCHNQKKKKNTKKNTPYRFLFLSAESWDYSDSNSYCHEKLPGTQLHLTKRSCSKE